MKEIRCNSCNALFGKEDKGQLTIKNRDLYRYIEGGSVWGPCRGCGSEVEWMASDDSEGTGQTGFEDRTG